MSARFQVEVNGQIRKVELVFGTDRDLAALTRFRCSSNRAENQRFRDALEFSRLAAKRWRYYRRSGLAVTSMADLRGFIRRDPQGEFGMMFLAKPNWRSSISYLGFCFARRSWCHHLIVDFLGTHPKVISNVRENVRGVGSGLLYQVVEIAAALSIPCIWGETTVNSVNFYRRATDQDGILDHFVIRGPMMDAVRHHYEKLHEPKLAFQQAK